MTESLNDCTTFEPQLSAHLLGELPDDEKAILDEHLAACETCRGERALLESAAGLIARSAPTETALEPEERGKILHAAAVSRRPRQARWLLRGAAVAAAAAVVVALSWLYIQSEIRRAWEATSGIEHSDTDPDVRSGNVPRNGGRLEGELLARAEPKPRRALSDSITAGETRHGRQALREAAGEPARTFAGPELMLKPQGGQPSPGIPTPVDGTANSWVRLNERQPKDGVVVGGVSPRARDLLPEAEVSDAIGQTTTRLSTAGDPSDPYVYRAPQGPKPTSASGAPSAAPPRGTGSAGRAHSGRVPEGGLLVSRYSTEANSTSPGQQMRPNETIQEAAVPTQDRLNFPSEEEWKEARKRGRESPQDVAGLESALRAARQERNQVLQGGELLARNTERSDKSLDEALLDSNIHDAAPPAEGLATTDPVDTSEKGGANLSKPVTTVDWKARVDEILSRLDRRAGETPDMMFFRYWGNNPFVEAAADRLSTFGVDCDTASYTLTRSYLYKQGILPPKEAVRTEEFINYFKSHYAPPTEDGRAFAVHAELAPSPFAHEPEYKLLKVGLKGREVSRAERKACSLVFVIDTSGSMRRESRLELVKDALRLLVGELDEGDTIGMVEFSTQARKVIDPVSVSSKERILDALSRLQPQNSTNVGEGLRMGYRMAVDNKLADGVNRVILLSDGVANTGTTQAQGILDLVRSERQRGIYLTTVGVGMGNHNDALLEQLADRGNGQCVYVDRVDEARKVFVENLTGTLETIAKDVKIQVEFDPKRVIRYRLLGYENRNIADHQFRDNTVDAGEVGAGHEVTALYELKLQPGEEASKGKVATVRVRYLTVDHGEAVEFEKPVEVEAARTSVDDTSPCFRLSACAAELAEVLRESYWARGGNLAQVASLLESVLPIPAVEGGRPLGEDSDVVELVALVRKADALVRQRQARMDDIARAVDAIKDNYYLRARIEGELARRQVEDRTYLEDLQRQNDDLRRKLEELLAR